MKEQWGCGLVITAVKEPCGHQCGGREAGGQMKTNSAGHVASSMWGREGKGHCPLMAAVIKGDGGKQGWYFRT
jgi:hypothetical protein